MKALLIVNTFATATSSHTQALISSKLEKYLELSVVETEHKLHAFEIAKRAKSAGFDFVIGLGGDGTLNEIANGILANGISSSNPVIAGIPGGNANVFLRNLGYSKDPIQATHELLEKIATNQRRSIGMGRITFKGTNRWFLFNAGIGIDARVLARMESKRIKGKSVSDFAYAAIAAKEFINEINEKKSKIEITDETKRKFDPVQFALIINFSPWTYFGKFPVSPIDHRAETNALDLFASYQIKFGNLFTLIKGLISNSKLVNDSQNLVLQDLKQFQISTDTPIWAQVDGEVIAEITSANIQHFADCLTVIA